MIQARLFQVSRTPRPKTTHIGGCSYPREQQSSQTCCACFGSLALVLCMYSLHDCAAPCSTMSGCTRTRTTSSQSDTSEAPLHRAVNPILHASHSALAGGACPGNMVTAVADMLPLLRICPGRFFAEDSVWMTVALMLHVFDISNPEGVPAKVDWSSGLVRFVSIWNLIVRYRFSLLTALTAFRRNFRTNCLRDSLVLLTLWLASNSNGLVRTSHLSGYKGRCHRSW